MNVLQVRTVETCLDGTVRREIRLDGAVTREFIDRLGTLGRLEYFPRFARPFFRITRDGGYVIKGVEGGESFEVLYISGHEDHEREILACISAEGRPSE